jgi:hypothetical protein
MNGYKTLTASETVARLKRLDYCDEHRTAEIISHLGAVAAASAGLAQVLMDLQPLLRDINYKANGRKEMEAWCDAIRSMDSRGISG